MRYPGGKNADGTWQRIVNQLPPHRLYCEPFLGSGAILRRKRPAPLSIALDLDPGAIAEFREAAWADLAGVDVVEVRPRYIDRYRPSFAGRPSLPLLHADAFEFLPSWPWAPGDLIYCDPPYLPETRTKKRIYAHELSAADHRRLVTILRRLPCRVLLSGYPSALYTKTLGDWRRIEFEAMTRGGHTATECLWANYPEPDQLHDYRQLGADYRQRERIRRQQRNWARRLARLPALERRAMLTILTEETEE